MPPGDGHRARPWKTHRLCRLSGTSRHCGRANPEGPRSCNCFVRWTVAILSRSPPASGCRLPWSPEGRFASLRDGPAAHPSPSLLQPARKRLWESRRRSGVSRRPSGSRRLVGCDPPPDERAAHRGLEDVHPPGRSRRCYRRRPLRGHLGRARRSDQIVSTRSSSVILRSRVTSGSSSAIAVAPMKRSHGSPSASRGIR
jgi:hypothetical protein